VGDFTLTSGSGESVSMEEQTGFTAIMTLPGNLRLRLSGSWLDCAALGSNGYVLTAHGKAGTLSFNSRIKSTPWELWPRKQSSEAIIDVNLSTSCAASVGPRASEHATGTSYSTKRCNCFNSAHGIGGCSSFVFDSRLFCQECKHGRHNDL